MFVFVYILLSSVFIAQPAENHTIYFDTEKKEQNHFENKTFKKNSVYIELLGNGVIYSLGYERIFWSDNIYRFSTMSGFSYYIWELYFSQQINLLIGKKNNFELGFGCTLPIVEPIQDGSNMSYLFFYRIGYRYQKEDGGMFFRIGFTPFSGRDLHPPKNWPVWPWGGITVGWMF